MVEFSIQEDLLTLALGHGSSVVVKSGCISTMSAHLNVRPIVHDSDEDDVYMHLTEVQNLVVHLPISGGQTWIFRDTAFLAATANVRIEYRHNVLHDRSDRLFDDEVTPLTRASLASGDTGSVFVFALGKSHRHDIDAGDSLLVNGGLFLAAPADSHMQPTPTTNLYAGAEGVSWVLMKFNGPAHVITQSQNVESFAAEIDHALYGRGDDDHEEDSDEDLDSDDEDEDEEEDDDYEEDEDEVEDEDEDYDDDDEDEDEDGEYEDYEIENVNDDVENVNDDVEDVNDDVEDVENVTKDVDCCDGVVKVEIADDVVDVKVKAEVEDDLSEYLSHKI
ncbi:hypothetical protein TSOC_011072 [Tetrabaena socialis]|uniref:Uncharacterized protein n=1 Tax=Tetrabaena socialis TaxID=47790 RepID=A0A2J7ZRM0_9CHLO|nr:hypothetical protein TSOC_011072 [Tetrabaena socialis]|eukprot:PNH02917.1 hypothetical protein TSOC_011072 [Tetrabaena socialis]